MIKQYQKLPVTIEAVQFMRNNIDEVESFVGKRLNMEIEKCINGKCYCEIETLEGLMKCNEFDYVIKGVNGEFYPCKPDIFVKTYVQL